MPFWLLALLLASSRRWRFADPPPRELRVLRGQCLVLRGRYSATRNEYDLIDAWRQLWSLRGLDLDRLILPRPGGWTESAFAVMVRANRNASFPLGKVVDSRFLGTVELTSAEHC